MVAHLLTLTALLGPVASLYINGSVIAPCDSPIYCYGELLQAIELARPFEDSKTFVDLPTTRPLDEVLAAFAELPRPIFNGTELNEFLTRYFGEAGSEIAPVPLEELETNPVFLNEVADPSVADFLRQVVDIWPDLTRQYVGEANCEGCVDSFLDLSRTFVVAGGRFREPYYWDSFWIIEGLLRTRGSYTEIARNIIENFLDFVEQFGFVPNGARVYYLNRSQPPLLTQMVRVYIEYTGDVELLDRALPLLVKEQEFWSTNRSIAINVIDEKGSDGEVYTLNRYAVRNNQPRPESFYEDYVTANNESFYAETGQVFPARETLSEEEKDRLYANLASAAESGWDFSSRWLTNPDDAVSGEYFPLRSLNTMDIIPVDLNSILYHNEIVIADFLRQTGQNAEARQWQYRAEHRQKAMYELMWNEKYSSYFDYNVTSCSQNIFIPADNNTLPIETPKGTPEGKMVQFAVSQYYPFWTGAAPDKLLKNATELRKIYARVENRLDTKKGAVAATNIETGEQWDEPNVWPPLQYILMQGLRQVPAVNNTVDDYEHVQGLALRIAQRYLDSAFCTWRAFGGATRELEQIEGAMANGTIFEKYSDEAINVAGTGGEYEVVEGFGWTNGVLIWSGDIYGGVLKRPECGDIVAAVDAGEVEEEGMEVEEEESEERGDVEVAAKRRMRKRSAVEIHKRDLEFIKRY